MAENSRLKVLDKKYLWHPFTQMREWEKDDPLIIERGDENYLIDTDGRKYLDGVSAGSDRASSITFLATTVI